MKQWYKRCFQLCLNFEVQYVAVDEADTCMHEIFTHTEFSRTLTKKISYR